MAYNNAYLIWSDFLDDKAPVFINQLSLSINLKSLLDKEYINKDDLTKKYRITDLGKLEYFQVLEKYAKNQKE